MTGDTLPPATPPAKCEAGGIASASIVAHVGNASHCYGSSITINDVTVEIPARTMVGLIGPDGVGKSTLLALIAGVRKIQAGTVTVFDGDMAEPQHLKEVRRRIAYMPQGL